MSEHDPTHELVRAARARLTSEATQLDDRTRRRLQHARQRALEAAPRRRFGGWLPVTAVAAAVALTAVFAVQLAPRAPLIEPIVEADADAFSDIELLAEGEDLALFEELEFYAWLSTADEDLS